MWLYVVSLLLLDNVLALLMFKYTGNTQIQEIREMWYG